MALSCVYRTGQRFGAQYLITVLRGALDDERISRFGHDRLSTFGIGKEISQNEWHSIFRQLIAAGYLSADQEYGSLILMPESKAVLAGKLALAFRRDPAPKRERGAKRHRRTHSTGAGAGDAILDFDQNLFEALRRCRLELAKQQGVPSYVIFHDRTLREMAQRVPTSPADLLEISGVGETKKERYGAAFLSVIRKYQDRPSTATT